MSLRLMTHAEQVATHLRSELTHGRWGQAMPGIHRLEKELGVNHNTIHAALQLLEEEGLLVGQGHGRPRRIELPDQSAKSRQLHLKILLYEGIDRGLPDNVELLARLQEAGHAAEFAPKSLRDLGMNRERVAGFVARHPADAWVISAGSREILEWFSSQPIPAMAMFGRFSGLSIAAASPRKTPALITAVRRLVSLGHRRIVMLTREERRKPQPALFEQNFLDELKAQGLMTGPYNLPDWEETLSGFQKCMDSLFRHTPPSAFIANEASIFFATHQYLARRQIMVPDAVSLICDDPNPVFAWCQPAISHIRWDYRPVVQQVLRWANNVAKGREDRRQTLIQAEFVEGGTIGPPP